MVERSDEAVEGVSGRNLPLLVARGLTVAATGGGPEATLGLALSAWGPVLQAALTAVVLGGVGAGGTELGSAQIAGGALALAGAGGTLAAYLAALGVGSLGATALVPREPEASSAPGVIEVGAGAWVGRRTGGSLSSAYALFDVGAGLVLVATVDADERELAEVRALGEVRWVLAPSPRWAEAAKSWCAGLPSASLCGAAGADAAPLGVGLAPPWPPGVLEVGTLPVGSEGDELCVFHRPSGTLFVADALVHASSAELSGGARWPYRLALMLDRPGPAIGARLAAARARRRSTPVARWPVERLVVRRGPMVTRAAASVLVEALAG